MIKLRNPTKLGMSSVQRGVMGPAITHTYSEGPGLGEVRCAVLTTQQQYLSTAQHHTTLLLLRGKFLRFNKLVEKYFQIFSCIMKIFVQFP